MAAKQKKKQFNQLLKTKPYRVIKDIYAEFKVVSEILTTAERQDDRVVQHKMFQSAVKLAKQAASNMKSVLDGVKEDGEETGIGKFRIQVVGETIKEFRDRVQQRKQELAEELKQIEYTIRQFNCEHSELGNNAVQAELSQKTHTKEDMEISKPVVGGAVEKQNVPEEPPYVQKETREWAPARAPKIRSRHVPSEIKNPNACVNEDLRRQAEQERARIQRPGIGRRIRSYLGLEQTPEEQLAERDADKEKWRFSIKGNPANIKAEEDKLYGQTSMERSIKDADTEEKSNVVHLFPGNSQNTYRCSQ